MSDHSLSLSLTQYGYVMQTKLKFGHDLSKFNIDLSKSLPEYVKAVREAFMQEKCSFFLTLFKKPLTSPPLPPLSFERLCGEFV